MPARFSECLRLSPVNRLLLTWVMLGAVFLTGNFILATEIHAQVQAPGQTDQVPRPAQPGESLSEQLDRSKGVITPPAGIDPGIEAPAPEPNPGTTRVIPPPGSPGGDSDVQPK